MRCAVRVAHMQMGVFPCDRTTHQRSIEVFSPSEEVAGLALMVPLICAPVGGSVRCCVVDESGCAVRVDGRFHQAHRTAVGVTEQR